MHSIDTKRSILATLLAFAAALMACGCAQMEPYRTAVPAGIPAPCSPEEDGKRPAGMPRCMDQATEANGSYVMHVVEFDDQGWPRAIEDSRGVPESQTDSAIRQIKVLLEQQSHPCVRLFVYVHGWRHNADTRDENVGQFRQFLGDVSRLPPARTIAADPACDNAPPSRIKTVGIYLAWRGLSLPNAQPLVYASFWDRKNTADRVAQGSVRELFGRLSALAAQVSLPATSGDPAGPSSGRLRTYVIGHSFGAAIVFRALSQSLIDSFSGGLDGAAGAEPSRVSRFVDMVVLVNPAIEAARFDPLFRAAAKRAMQCGAPAAVPPVCPPPKYQAPVLAIFTSEGDLATKLAFPIGASLSNTFETTVSDAQSRSIRQTIGWDDDYITHAMTHAVGPPLPSQASPWEGPDESSARYKDPGWTWRFEAGPGNPVALTQLGASSAQPGSHPIYNGPLWNARVSKGIIASHNDIWNAVFHEVLLRLFTDQRAHPVVVEGVAPDRPPAGWLAARDEAAR